MSVLFVQFPKVCYDLLKDRTFGGNTMEMTLYRTIHVKTPDEKVITLQKPFESSSIPQEGDFIKDSMFVDPDEIEVISVDKNEVEQTVAIHLRPIEMNYATDEHNQNMVNAYKANGWISDSY